MPDNNPSIQKAIKAANTPVKVFLSPKESVPIPPMHKDAPGNLTDRLGGRIK